MNYSFTLRDSRPAAVKPVPVYKSRSSRSHDHHRDRDYRDRHHYEHGDHDRVKIRIKEEPRSRSPSRETFKERDRDYDRRRRDPPVRIKEEPRSPRNRSRSRSRETRDRDRDRDFERRRDPVRRHEEHRNRSRSREKETRDRDYNGRRRDPVREKEWDNFFKPDNKVKSEKTEDDKYGIVKSDKDEETAGAAKVEKEKPNFGLSGKLTEETNTFRGVVIKYSEPPEARKPQKIRWRLYPFKGEEGLPVMFIHRQSAYLLGRDRKIADIPIDHPSCSKQHAVLQYRLQPYTRKDGTKGRRVKPYIIDLESANGTLVNGEKIDTKRYVELFEKDVLKFGFSSREYVLLNEYSKDEPDDDEEIGSTTPLPDDKADLPD